MPRWLDVHLPERRVDERPWPKEEVWRAGRYRTVRTLLDLGVPRVDPLAEENPLVFVAGPLAGTTFSNANRLSVGAKSPLTGGVKESNSGGTLAFAMGQWAIAGFTLFGRAPDWVVLVIGEKGVRFLDGREFLGQGTYATVAELRRRFPKSAVAAIGPVGEYQGLLAGISITDTDGLPGRIAGRGGLGAVMGAKRVKAIVIENPGTPPREKKKFFDELRAYGKLLRENPVTGDYYPKLGTAGMADYQNVAGGLPVKNFRYGRLTEGPVPIGGEALRERILERDGQGTPTHACMPGC
ncbi:MAG TPA: aldehyde ferredoxin oxidoreductase, partial [Oceanithermus sp.]|nr:aldehyde ferredoxin oxidoreductase [Oceanithermus sp.]